MFENAEESELLGRLRAAGANYFGGDLTALVSGAGLKAVEDLGDGRFRVTIPEGFHEAPGSYAGIREGLERAASQCGYGTAPEGPAGGYDRYVLTPRG